MEIFETINWGILLPVIIIQLILMTIALIDCIRSEETKGPKLMWVLIIIFINIIGPIAYFVLGRRSDT